MKTALILGCAGQDGSYLAELLLAKGYRVVGLVRNGTADLRFSNIAHIADKMELIAGDICDARFMAWLIKSVMPDEMYNLAAMSFVKRSFEKPIHTLNVDGVAVAVMLDIIKRLKDERGHSIKFYQASTSEMFGNNYPRTKLDEDSEFYPQSPYASAKLYAHNMVKIYREAYDLFACSGILFNHESPRRGYEFVTRKITRAVARMKLGLQDSIELGNLDAYRDWGFAGDYVEAMWLMLQQEIPTDYVIGTGETRSVAEFYKAAIDAANLKNGMLAIRENKELLRPREVHKLCANPIQAKANLKWKPKIEFYELVQMMVENDLKLEKK